MNTEVIQEPTNHRKVNSILVSQPEPTDPKSPYYVLAQKYGIKIEFRQFIRVEGLSVKDFRRAKATPTEFSAIIFTSKNAVTHFFRLCADMRLKMSPETKYFCSSEAIANFLQKFIFFRKRKVFFPKIEKKNAFQELLKKHRKGETYLFPCTVNRVEGLPEYLKANNFKFTEAPVYETVFSDFSDMGGKIDYDMLVFFTPIGIHSLFHNFPDFVQNDTRIAIMGENTLNATIEHLLRVDIKAPQPGLPSITAAIEDYLKKIAQEPVDGNNNLVL